MKRKHMVRAAAAVLACAALTGAALALSTGDSLISLSYLNDTYIPTVVAQGTKAADEKLIQAYQAASQKLDEVNQGYGVQQGSGGSYSADLRSRTFHQGDTLTLPAGSGVLAMAGTGEVIHSGAFIDVTEGVEIPSGSKLTPGHRYLAGEDTSAVISVRSGAMYLGLQGSYGYEPGGGDPMPFVDVAQGDWFQSAVEYVYGNGLFSGMSADRFSPGTTMNRAMLVTVFYRLAGSPEGELNAADASFTDVYTVAQMDTDTYSVDSVTGVAITSHQETEGVGTDAMTQEYLDQYVGKSGTIRTAGDNSVDAASGATATSALSPERLTLIFAASAICPSAARHSSATESTFARSSDWGMTTDSSSDIFSTSLMSSISRSTSTPIMVMKRF